MIHRAGIWREKAHVHAGMWKGECLCGHKTQYWNWGATIGAMLHHLWKVKHNS